MSETKIKNGDMPAMPIISEDGLPSLIEFIAEPGGGQCTGLTKREKFAMAAMQGILASQYYAEFASEPSDEGKPSGAAESAVKHADALLAELERTQ